jgi:hypothetical protein
MIGRPSSSPDTNQVLVRRMFSPRNSIGFLHRFGAYCVAAIQYHEVSQAKTCPMYFLSPIPFFSHSTYRIFRSPKLPYLTRHAPPAEPAKRFKQVDVPVEPRDPSVPAA